MKIVAITGTNGAGKGAVVEYLKQKGFLHFSVRNFLEEEIKNRGMKSSRESMHLVANDLRQKYSPSYLIESLYKEAEKTGRNCVIESIRTPGEIDFLKKQGSFALLAVDADPKLRYDRIVRRKSASDHVSLEKFLFEEEREMGSTDPNKQNMSECIRQADFVIVNEGSLQQLHQQIDLILPKILGN